MGLLKKLFGDYSAKELKKIQQLVDAVLALEDKYSALTDNELRGMTDKFKDMLANGHTLDNILPDAFAVCREASWRVLGMKHFPVQIIGGIILHQGRISEMKTGEGKTLVATLPAYLNAIEGKGVHIVTVNDYLAKRDSEWMGKVYRFLGLEVGLIIHGMTHEEKQQAYNADITYCTNNELGFDYLRDNMVTYKEQRVQRGHNFAIVDEVDSILIDEARTPLIISGKGAKSTELYSKANQLARNLKKVTVKEMDDKQSDEAMAYDGDYVVDEKAKTCVLTPQGVKKAEEFFGIDNLNDSDNIEISHHVNTAIRAHGIMKRDVDYVVKDGEVIIVDEFTGRLMFGRRYNEGLHQAIEAKEGVQIANESKTLATITFQNFFRLYKKLSGMTGTALTEENEFREIYKLDVIEIPTNKPLARNDLNDIVYKTEKAKFLAVINKIVECNSKGQPVLVGTISIEKSELLSALLKKRGIKHNVLNAKNHEHEAEIIAQAGKLGAVTIATNMAGRGTDIMLGGNAEYLSKAKLRAMGFSEEIISEATGYAETEDKDIIEARKIFTESMAEFKAEISPEAEKVRAAGGLCIIGTERHESRRIDNQLRGRAGRQGDPGESVFFISMEDDLLRLFGGERMYRLMETLNIDESMPLNMTMLSNSIETAQQRIEGRNFSIRKNVLEYDDVMNKQRELIYEQRNKVLDGEDISASVSNMIDGVIDNAIADFLYYNTDPDERNIQGFRDYFMGWLLSPTELEFDISALKKLSNDEIKSLMRQKIDAVVSEKEEKFGKDLMREVERVMLLRSVDTHWMDHIDAMDELRNGIGLRAYGQHNPVIEYRNEGYNMFNEMTEAIREETVKRMIMVQIGRQEEVKREKVAEETSAGDSDGSVSSTVRGAGRVPKNALCPCGSGKKYKRCCGKDEN